MTSNRKYFFGCRSGSRRSVRRTRVLQSDLRAGRPSVLRLAGAVSERKKERPTKRIRGRPDIDRTHRRTNTIASPLGDYFVEVGITDRPSSTHSIDSLPARQPSTLELAPRSAPPCPASFKLLAAPHAQLDRCPARSRPVAVRLRPTGICLLPTDSVPSAAAGRARGTDRQAGGASGSRGRSGGGGSGREERHERFYFFQSADGRPPLTIRRRRPPLFSSSSSRCPVHDSVIGFIKYGIGRHARDTPAFSANARPAGRSAVRSFFQLSVRPLLLLLLRDEMNNAKTATGSNSSQTMIAKQRSAHAVGSLVESDTRENTERIVSSARSDRFRLPARRL